MQKLPDAAKILKLLIQDYLHWRIGTNITLQLAVKGVNLIMMKNIKYIAGVALIAASLTACSGGGSSKTLGGSTDTMDAVAGSNAGGVNRASSGDTSQDGNKNRGKDSTSNGNANPSGHLENDTTNQSKNHRPR